MTFQPNVRMRSTMITNNTNIAPAIVPPPSIIPNFVDPYSLEQAFDATAVLCLLLATLAVALRFAVGLCRSPKRIRVEECRLLSAFMIMLRYAVRDYADMTRYLRDIMGD